MAVESPPAFLQAGTYGAEQTRRAIASLLARGSTIGSIAGGLVSAGDCEITPPGSGMTVNVAPGEVWVPGTLSATQSGYYSRVSSSTSLAIATADATKPRIDTVVAVVADAAYTGSSNTFAVAVVTGTPTSGANLTNLSGAGTPPANSLVLGYVLVPANATSITSGDIDNVGGTVALRNTLVGTGASAQIGGVEVNTGAILQSYGGADPNHVLDPWQPTPVEFGLSSAGVYADNGSGQINQVNGYVSNAGSRPSVGVGGWGIGQHVWGGNFVGIGETTGAVAWGVEIDAGYHASSGTGAGGALFLVGAQGESGGVYTGVALRVGANDSHSSFADGIIFRSDSGGQPVQSAGSLFTADSGVTCATGVDFIDVAFTVAAARLSLNSGSTAGTAALILDADGGFANAGNFITIQAQASSSGKYGLYFSSAIAQPITNALIVADSGISTAAGIDFSMASFTGAALALPAAGKLGFFGATPSGQVSTTGSTTGFSAGSGANVLAGSTFTGNTGTKAYTVNDLVLALKTYGLLAAS